MKSRILKNKKQSASNYRLISILKKASFIIFLFNFGLYAQVGINNTSPKATLEITASNAASPSNKDGLLVPKVNAFPASNPGADQHSMVVYLTTTDGSDAKGFYYWDNDQTKWVAMGLKAAVDTNTDTNIEWINQLTDAKSDNDGSEDGSSIFLGINAGANDDSSDNQNIGIGYNSLSTATTANGNIAIGYESMVSATTTMNNIALGINALNSQTTGGSNIAIGANTLSSTTTKWSMIAIGSNALTANTTGGTNLAIGNNALKTNTTGGKNTAIGVATLENAIDVENTMAIGAYSLRAITTGEGNTGIGAYTLKDYTGDASKPNGHTAVGNLALSKLTTGIGNTAIGFEALEWGALQEYTTAIGHFAGFHAGRDSIAIGGNTFIGKSAGFASTGSNNVFIGQNAGGHGTGTGSVDYATGSDNVFIGNGAGNNSTAGDNDDQLIIANSNTTTPLIYGEFDNNTVEVNGTVAATGFIASSIATSAPSNSEGEIGEIRIVKVSSKWYIYVKVAANTWKREELS